MVNRIRSARKVRKNVGTSKFEYSEGPLEDVLGMSRINLSGTFLERRIRTSPESHFRTSLGPQIRKFPGRSNRIFRGTPGDVGGVVLGPSWGPIFAGWDRSLLLSVISHDLLKVKCRLCQVGRMTNSRIRFSSVNYYSRFQFNIMIGNCDFRREDAQQKLFTETSNSH